MTEWLRCNGRTLAYRVQGPAGGYPVFYCHGIPGSRLEPVLFEATLARCPIRIISMDRPGYGESLPADDYTLADHAADVAAIADHLGFTRFALFGFSGGGVFALVAAAILAARVDRLVLVATPAPALLADPFVGTGELTANTWREGRDNPHALPGQLNALSTDGDTLANALLDALSDSDRGLLAEGDNQARFRENMAATVAQGAEVAAAAMARDIILTISDWRSHAEEARQPAHVFHGDADALLALRHGKALADALPRGQLEIGSGAGHYAGIYGAPAAGLWVRAAGTQVEGDSRQG